MLLYLFYYYTYFISFVLFDTLQKNLSAMYPTFYFPMQ